MVSAPNQPAVAACAPVSSPSAQQPRARPQHRPPPEAATTPAQSPASDTPAATAAAPAVPRSATPPFQASRAPREPAPNTPPHDASPPAAASQTDTATQSAPHPARRNHARPDPRSAAAAHLETAVTTARNPGKSDPAAETAAPSTPPPETAAHPNHPQPPASREARRSAQKKGKGRRNVPPSSQHHARWLDSRKFDRRRELISTGGFVRLYVALAGFMSSIASRPSAAWQSMLRGTRASSKGT